MKWIGLLLLLRLASSAQDTCSDGECTGDEGEQYKGLFCVVKRLKQKDTSEPKSWKRFRENIEKAEAAYIECTAEDCSCTTR